MIVPLPQKIVLHHMRGNRLPRKQGCIENKREVQTGERLTYLPEEPRTRLALETKLYTIIQDLCAVVAWRKALPCSLEHLKAGAAQAGIRGAKEKTYVDNERALVFVVFFNESVKGLREL